MDGWGGRLAQAGCQLREKAALEGLRRCPGLCPHVLPKPCLEVPQGERKAQSYWSPSSSENDVQSWICKVEAIGHHPPPRPRDIEPVSSPATEPISTCYSIAGISVPQPEMGAPEIGGEYCKSCLC